MEPELESLRGYGRGEQLVEEAEQGRALEEVGAGDGLDPADGFHQRLRLDAADGEQALHITPGPGFGARALDLGTKSWKLAEPAGGLGHTSSIPPRKTAVSSLPHNRHSCRLRRLGGERIKPDNACYRATLQE